MTFDFLMALSNLCPSYGHTGRMLLGICRYAIAVLLKRANHGPWEARPLVFCLSVKTCFIESL